MHGNLDASTDGFCTPSLLLEKEREWKGPFYFIQGADTQFGLMKAWSTGNCDTGGDEWGQEIRLTEQAVEAINKLNPKPKFFVLCGDLVHAMPGKRGCQGGPFLLQPVLSKYRQEKIAFVPKASLFCVAPTLRGVVLFIDYQKMHAHFLFRIWQD